MTKIYRTLKVFQDPRGVLSICLDRPSVRNAFNHEMIEDLTLAFSSQVHKPTVRCVVLRGEGAVFCAGGDLNWMRKSIDFSF